MTEAEWLASDDPFALLKSVRERVSTRKLYLLSLVCTRRLYNLKPAGVAAMDAFETAIEVTDVELAVKALSSAHPNYGFAFSPWIKATSATKGKRQSTPLVREILGNPYRPVTFSPSWRTDTVLAIARQVYESRDFSAMPILADALQDAGCEDEDVLIHCRDATVAHVRGCWVVDLVLGKE